MADSMAALLVVVVGSVLAPRKESCFAPSITLDRIRERNLKMQDSGPQAQVQTHTDPVLRVTDARAVALWQHL